MTDEPRVPEHFKLFIFDDNIEKLEAQDEQAHQLGSTENANASLEQLSAYYSQELDTSNIGVERADVSSEVIYRHVVRAQISVGFPVPIARLFGMQYVAAEPAHILGPAIYVPSKLTASPYFSRPALHIGIAELITEPWIINEINPRNPADHAAATATSMIYARALALEVAKQMDTSAAEDIQQYIQEDAMQEEILKVQSQLRRFGLREFVARWNSKADAGMN